LKKDVKVQCDLKLNETGVPETSCC